MLSIGWVLVLAVLCLPFHISRADGFPDEWDWQFPVSQGSGFPQALQQSSVKDAVANDDDASSQKRYSDGNFHSFDDSLEYGIKPTKQKNNKNLILDLVLNWDSNSSENSKTSSKKKNSCETQKPVFDNILLGKIKDILWDKSKKATLLAMPLNGDRNVYKEIDPYGEISNVGLDEPEIGQLLLTDLIEDQNAENFVEQPVYTDFDTFENINGVSLWDKPKEVPKVPMNLIEDNNDAKFIELPILYASLEPFEKTNDVILWDTPKNAPLLPMNAVEDNYAAFEELPADTNLDYFEKTNDGSLWDKSKTASLVAIKLIKDKHGAKFVGLPVMYTDQNPFEKINNVNLDIPEIGPLLPMNSIDDINIVKFVELPVYTDMDSFEKTDDLNLWDKTNTAPILPMNLIEDILGGFMGLPVDTNLKPLEQKYNVNLDKSEKTAVIPMKLIKNKYATFGLPEDTYSLEEKNDENLLDKTKRAPLLAMKLIKDKHGIKFVGQPINSELDTIETLAATKNLNGFWRLALESAVLNKLRLDKQKKIKQLEEAEEEEEERGPHQLAFIMKGKRHMVKELKQIVRGNKQNVSNLQNYVKLNNVNSVINGVSGVTDPLNLNDNLNIRSGAGTNSRKEETITPSNFLIDDYEDYEEDDIAEPENPALGMIVAKGKKFKKSFNAVKK